MVISPLAGALSDRIGRRPLMVTGLALLSGGYWWVAATDSVTASWTGLTLALLVSGVGVSMALPTVPAAVLGAVTPAELGKASGINYMAQRFGSVFAVAIATAVFSASGHLGTPASVIAGFRPALATCAGLALLAAVCAIAITSRPPVPAVAPVPRERAGADRA
jgi:MFS family permease